ncbi:dihydrofolate reductase [Flavobacteriaceae bacterium]|nr:dihydrofolate reductase [Flavobacteriaceae bacterium]
MHINGIVANSRNRGIGLNNKLPWKLPEDLKRFQRLTTGKGFNAVIMGRNTWESIPFLKNRDNLILSSTLNLDYEKEGNIVKTFNSIGSLQKYYEDRNYEKIWIIGGSEVYKQFIDANLLDHIYMTYINDEYNCDTYFPKLPENYFLIQKTPICELTERGKNTYILVYKQLKVGVKVIYDFNEWTLQKIHYEDSPKLYFTIQKSDGREKQTVKERIKLL